MVPMALLEFEAASVDEYVAAGEGRGSPGLSG
jgi:hypothetical protein